MIEERNDEMRLSNTPDEETREAAQPIKEELERALSKIDTPEKAEALIERLTEDTEGVKALDAAQAVPQAPDAPPEQQVELTKEVVERAEEEEPDAAVPEAAAAIEALAAEAAALDGPAYEAVVEAVQQVTDPSLQGEQEKLKEPRRYLWDALMSQPSLTLVNKVDTALFIAINNGPRSERANRFFQQLSFWFNGGWAWLIGAALAWPFRRAQSTSLLKRIAVPIWVAALIVEGPVKKYFRRRRPFIDVVRAIVVGKKPGNWSFPSGHAAAAFAGAWMMDRCLPKWRWLWYSIASIVAFSRVYLGAHYPGDIVSGSALGTLLAELTRRFMRRAGWWQ